MQKTKIEYVNYSCNPIKGLCQQGCSYCYARKIYKRFKLDLTVRFDYKELDKLASIKKPSRIFMCSTHDIMGKWIPDDWIQSIISAMTFLKEHTFLILTKNPMRLREFEFPKNCWLGQTIIHKGDYVEIPNHNIKFISFEPLLDNEIGNYRFPADWYIIGGLTPKSKHSQEAIEKILSQASYFDTPVFIKHNANYPEIKQEYPNALHPNP